MVSACVWQTVLEWYLKGIPAWTCCIIIQWVGGVKCSEVSTACFWQTALEWYLKGIPAWTCCIIIQWVGGVKCSEVSTACFWQTVLEWYYLKGIPAWTCCIIIQWVGGVKCSENGFCLFLTDSIGMISKGDPCMDLLYYNTVGWRSEVFWGVNCLFLTDSIGMISKGDPCMICCIIIQWVGGVKCSEVSTACFWQTVLEWYLKGIPAWSVVL